MDNTTKTAATGTFSAKFRRLTQYLSPRHWSFWVILALLLYTLMGFLLVPYGVKNGVVRLLERDLGRSAQIEAVKFNPYTLSLTVHGFEVRDTDGVRLAAFTRFSANFELISLFNRAWTFDAVRLEEPYVYVQRFAANDSRLSRLLTDISAGRTDKAASHAADENDSNLPRLLIYTLQVTKGQVALKDDVPATSLELQLGPIDIVIQALSTLPNQSAQQNATIELPGHGRLDWEGSLALAPLHAAGKLSLKNARLHYLLAYLQPLLPADALATMDVTLSSDFNYQIQSDSGGTLTAQLDQLALELDKLRLSGLTPPTEFLTITKFALLGGTLRYPERTLRFASLRVEEPTITAWRDKDGGLSLADLIPAAPDDSKPENPDPGWQFSIDQASVNDARLSFSDQSIDPPGNFEINNLQIQLSEFDTRGEAVLPLNATGNLTAGGQFGIAGRLTVFPTFTLDAKAQAHDIPLTIGQPFVTQSAHVQLKNGILASNLELAILDDKRLTLKGEVQVSSLALHTMDNEPLLTWNKLDIDHFNLDLNASEAANSLHISRLNFDKPFGRFAIFADKTTNLSTLMIENKENAGGAQTDRSGTQPEPFEVVLGGILVNDGAMDFSDLSLPLPFATHIKNLNGAISTVATNSTQPATVKLEGQVNKYGLARIDGSANLFDPLAFTDITVEFRNLQMPNMSPYSARFAGRKIDQGKLTMDLHYAIDKGKLHGKNNILLSDLQLGKKLEGPGTTNLPLDLAVALLKDANGIIRADIPVSGDVNDPKFELGSVIREAVVGMITSAVTAPFRLLGKIIGITSDNFGEVQFLAGRADLTPPELEKFAALEKALELRPKIGIEIRGITAPLIDVPALKSIQLRNTLIGKLGGGQRTDGPIDIRIDGREALLDDELRKLLESLFTERYPDSPLALLQARHTVPPTDNPAGKPALDEQAYTMELRNRLLSSEVVGEQQLADLAQTRAQAIRTTLLANGTLDPARVLIAKPVQVKTADQEWVTLKLRLVPVAVSTP